MAAKGSQVSIRRGVVVLVLSGLLLGTSLFVRGSRAEPEQRFFPQTGHVVNQPLLRFWEQGGVELFGYPISAVIEERSHDDGQWYRVQYFERVRLELHPTASPSIQIGRLGAQVLAAQPPLVPAVAESGCIGFTETQERLCGAFGMFWQQRGGLAIFGLPLTPPVVGAAANGRTVVVQYTERARLEHDPVSGIVRLGLLGREGGISLPPPANPLAGELLQLINDERAAAGLASLAVAPELMASAQGHSQGMATSGLVSHTGSDGSSPQDRMQQAGYAWLRCGENIAVTQPTPREAVAFWMQSPPHRANILDPTFQELGVGVVADSATAHQFYWTLNLGRR